MWPNESVVDKRPYNYMDEPETMNKPWMSNSDFFPIVITYSITFIIGTVGNMTIVITMTREKASRNATSMFLVSLAIADLLLLLICEPLEIIHFFLLTWDQSNFICKLTKYVQMLSAVASVLNLTSVSFERYVVIIYPMKSRALCTMSNCRKALVVVWLVSFVLSAPIVVTKASNPVTYFNNVTNVTVYYCLDAKDDSGLPLMLAIYQLIIQLVLPLILMIFCYTRVIKELWVSTLKMSAMTRLNSSARFDSRSSISSTLRSSCHASSCTTVQSPPANASASTGFKHSPNRPSSNCDDICHARKQVIKMLILVIALFLICWSPILIINIQLKIGLYAYTQVMYTTKTMSLLLPFVHSCLNPIIYSFMSSNFRRMMVRACTNQTCGPVPSLCCQRGESRLRYKGTAYELGLNGDGPSTSTTTTSCALASGTLGIGMGSTRLSSAGEAVNLCSSDIRTSPTTECETMIHDSAIIA